VERDSSDHARRPTVRSKTDSSEVGETGLTHQAAAPGAADETGRGDERDPDRADADAADETAPD
jgi:hypothetical protein